MMQTATLAGGCFWCLEAVYLQLRGVTAVQSGYTGGQRANPTYEQVCTGATGHAEVVQVKFDGSVLKFEDLLEVFFAIHDPTTLNRQGDDIGTQYRSAIFFHDAGQEAAALKKIEDLTTAKAFSAPIVTVVCPLGEFFPAEDYHHNYFALNPDKGYCRAVVEPKVAKFRKNFASRLQ